MIGVGMEPSTSSVVPASFPPFEVASISSDSSDIVARGGDASP